MTTTLLKVRLIQLRRLVSGLGIFYTLFFLVLLAGLLLVINRQFQEPTGALLVIAAIAGLVFTMHRNRSDSAFILKHFPSPQRQLFTEYLVFTLPVALPAFLSPNWYFIFLLWAALGLIARLKTDIKQRTRWPEIARVIGVQNFEWISGIRQAFPFLAVLLALALATSWLKVVPLVFLWLFTVTVASFYQQCEPLSMLLAQGRTSKKLLLTKLTAHGRLLLIFSGPVLLINAVFNPELAWVNGVFLLLQLALLSFAILLKYSTYSPKANLRANSLLLSIASVGILIPFMLPLPLVMSLRNYGKAVRNLNRFLHDKPI